MCYTAADEDFQGRPAHVSMGAKTSTAQTGRCDVDGTEYCHGWVTAFFPAEQPKYAVTVLAEDGGYGNQAASPQERSCRWNKNSTAHKNTAPFFGCFRKAMRCFDLTNFDASGIMVNRGHT